MSEIREPFLVFVCFLEEPIQNGGLTNVYRRNVLELLPLCLNICLSPLQNYKIQQYRGKVQRKSTFVQEKHPYNRFGAPSHVEVA